MFGSLDGSDTDWQTKEAMEGLRLQQEDAAKKAAAARSWGDTWNDIKGIPANLRKMGGEMVASPQAFGSLNPDEAAMSPETFVNPLVKGTADVLGTVAKSGFTAPGDAMSGKLPMMTPEGHTTPEAVQRAFDTASMAGGASAAGTVGKVAADAGRAGAPIAAAAQAPRLYSAVEEAIRNSKMQAAPGSQWSGMLGNTPGIKPEELNWRGVTDLLSTKGTGKVTKDELLSHLEANPVKLEDSIKRDAPEWAKLTPDQQWAVNDLYESSPSKRQYGDVEDFYNSKKVSEELPESIVPAQTTFQQYTLPGGENYREHLLKLPEKTDEGLTGWDKITSSAQNYQGPHFKEDPNTVVHMRTTDRLMDATPVSKIEDKVQAAYPDINPGSFASGMPAKAVRDGVISPAEAADWARANRWHSSGITDQPGTGTKTLHLEELQSDWHQAGREKGYGDTLKDHVRIIQAEDGKFHTMQQGVQFPIGIASTKEAALDAAKKAGLMKAGVPDAPYKTTDAWAGLGIKRAIQHAAENGYDRVSWTPGEFAPTNPKNLGQTGVDAEATSAGLSHFYDRIMPKLVEKIGKEHGVKVQRGTVSGRSEGPASGESVMRSRGIPEAEQDAYWRGLSQEERQQHFEDYRNAGHPAFYFDIPKSLRDQATTKGFSLFEDAGAGAAPVSALAHAGGENVARGTVDAGAGAGRGARSLEEAQGAAARAAGAIKPLEGLPTPTTVLENGEHYVPGPIASVHDVAKSYMESTGRPYQRLDRHHPIDQEKSTAIAKAFDEMKHDPDNPAVKASYNAMINETRDQYHALEKSGVKIEAIPPGMPDPYAKSPRLAAKDLAENNHLWFFPTDQGFGTSAQGGIDMAKHPMMQQSGVTLNGQPLLNNDLFRVVHDYFGHLKEGNGFRAAGEDNAWRTHSLMYSPEARPAMTTETRGQNSWVNYGPHGATNRKASAADTVFADQKVGVMPDWTMDVPLDMSQEARLARAKEQGYDTGKVWYHSALQPIEQFDPHGKFMGRSGTSGIHLTDNPKMANRYLDRFGDVDYKGRDFNKNVTPVYVRAENPLERDKPFKTNIPLGAPIPENYVSPVEQLGHDALIRNEAISGRGGVRHVDPGARGAVTGREMVLTDPSKVRSVNAAFDPTRRASSKLLAEDSSHGTSIAAASKVESPSIMKTKVVDEQGQPIAGPAYTKEARRNLDEIAAGPKGAGPIDLSTQAEVPHVEQRALERYVPARGISPRMQEAMQDKNVRKGVEKSMRAGADVQDWYHTEPIRQEFVKTLGEKQGADAFKQYMDLIAATSPRSDVPTNIRNASYYYSGGDPTKTNPYPYGHVAQNLHKQNVATVSSDAGWDAMKNPKPASFAENLRGNLEPVTVDTHAFRNIAMRTGDPRFLETQIQAPYKGTGSEASLAKRYGELKMTPKGQMVVYRPQQLVKDGKLTMEEAKDIPTFWASKPKDNEYAAAENMFREAGNKVGMRPADAQAAAWSGAGQMTGLGTVGTHTFPELMNERITFTARMRNEAPKKVLQDFITGKRPLLSDPGVAGAPTAMFGSLDGRQ